MLQKEKISKLVENQKFPNRGKKDFKKLEKKLGVVFKNKDLLVRAFTHRSYLNENPKLNLKNNERLEFLGDAVLELIVTDYLFNNYSNQEGDLTSWRAALVKSQSLADLASNLNFGEFILLSKGESNDGGKARQYILADTFEAFLGALYLDQGYKVAKKFIENNLLPSLSKILEEEIWRDSKSTFQELSQEKMKITPTYKVLKEFGPDHIKCFVSGVFLGDKLIAEGEGSSKQESEENAAENALKNF